MKGHKVHTDASVKKNKSFHSYCHFDDNGRFIKGKVFKSEITKSAQAEEYSIAKMLEEMSKEDIKNFSVYTDNLGVKMKPSERIQKALNEMQGELLWIPREKNKLADKACKSGKEDFFEKAVKHNIYRKLARIEKPNETMYMGAITKEKIKEGEKWAMHSCFYNIMQELDRINVEEILEWCERKELSNTKQGREYAVKLFIEEKYGFVVPEDVEKEVSMKKKYEVVNLKEKKGKKWM